MELWIDGEKQSLNCIENAGISTKEGNKNFDIFLEDGLIYVVYDKTSYRIE